MGENQDPGSGINIPVPQHCGQHEGERNVLINMNNMREKRTFLSTWIVG
jgi:hypothetical protein